VVDDREAGMTSQVSLKSFWLKRVLLPAIVGGGIIGALSLSYLSWQNNRRVQDSLEAETGNLALFLADPVMTGEQIEVTKRVSTIGERSDLFVKVFSASGKELARFPLDWSQEEKYSVEGKADIAAPNGTFLGTVLTKKRNPGMTDNPVSIVILFLLMFIGVLIATMFFNARRIFDDMLKLGSSIEHNGADSNPFFLETKMVQETINRQYDKLLKAERERAFVDVVTEVAHDIRAPLAVLDITLASASNIPSANLRRMRDAVEQIKKTTSDLKQVKSMPQNEESVKKEIAYKRTPTQIREFLDSLIDQKMIQYKNNPSLKIKLNIADEFQSSAYCDPDWLKRTFSNLIDNAVEATDFTGIVSVNAFCHARDIAIEIEDNGRGMTPEQLQELGSRRILSRKENGMGLGVFMAKRTIEAFHGTISFSSVLTQGTVVTVRLPVIEMNNLGLQKLSIGKTGKIVVLDDDKLIRECWQMLGEKLDFKDRLVLFEDPSDFIAFLAGEQTEPIQCFVDYDLKNTMNGLDVIECANAAQFSTLVTGQFDSDEVIQRARQLEVKLFNKQQLAQENLIMAS